MVAKTRHDEHTTTSLTNVGVREFRDHATKYLAGSEPIAINRHGKVIGFYVPVQRDEDDVRDALVRLEKSVRRMTEITGLTEDELADLLDLSKPLPPEYETAE